MKFDREQFIRDLRELAEQGIPWVHKGRSLVGLDCVGGPRYAVEKQGIQLPAELIKVFDDYHRPPDGQKFLTTMRAWFTEIPKDHAEDGDLLVIYVRKNPCHLAVKMPEGIAEAYESMDGSVSKFLIGPLDPRRRIAACFRIPDFA